MSVSSELACACRLSPPCRCSADEEEERKKAEWREAAKKELEDWYKQHEESVSKTRAANRYR